MARITVEDCLKYINNYYDLVLISSHRTRMLQNGIDARVVDEGDKATVQSLREIGDGKVDATILGEPIPEMVTKEEKKSFSQLVFNKEEGDGVTLPPALGKLWMDNEEPPASEKETQADAADDKELAKGQADEDLLDTEELESLEALQEQEFSESEESDGEQQL